MSNRPKKYDCQSCGACCLDWDHRGYVPDLLDEDIEQMSEHYKRCNLVPVGSPSSNHFCLASQDGEPAPRCVALKGKLGESVRCHIYEHRPHICREFPPGSEECKLCRHEWRTL